MVTGVRFGSLGLVIVGTQLHGNSDYLGPAIAFALVNMVVAMFAAVETGRRTRSAAGTGLAAAADEGDTQAGDETPTEGDSGLSVA